MAENARVSATTDLPLGRKQSAVHTTLEQTLKADAHRAKNDRRAPVVSVVPYNDREMISFMISLAPP